MFFLPISMISDLVVNGGGCEEPEEGHVFIRVLINASHENVGEPFYLAEWGNDLIPFSHVLITKRSMIIGYPYRVLQVVG